MDKQDEIENLTTSVGIQHRLDALDHPPPVRRPSFSRSASDEDSYQDVPFVRKRAYAPVHQAVTSEQPSVFSAFHSPPLCSSPLPPGPGQCGSSSSCQLLLAAPQLLSATPHTINPQITHLRHRRSSRSFPVNSVKSRTSNKMNRSTLPVIRYAPSNVSAPIDCSSVVENTDPHPPFATTETSSLIRYKEDNSASFESNKPRDPALPPSDGHIFPRRAKSPDKCAVRAALGDILCSSFNVDPNESNEALWCKAGDAYRAIAFADGQITQRLAAAHKERQLRSECPDRKDLSEAMHYLYLNINKENKADSTWRSFNGSETWYGVATTGSTCHLAMSPQTSSGLGTSYRETASHWPHTRSLRCGPLPRRSDLNARRDLSGSFLSRQCLCKILSLDGSSSKTYSWKPYYMSVTDQEVRFIKASSAPYGINRPNKLSKFSSQVLTPQNLDSPRSKDESHYPSPFDDAKSVQSSRPLHHGLVTSSAGRTYHPKDSLSASCLILPIIGLMWNSEELPDDLPHWQPLGQVPVAHSQTVVPDHMDPSLSGLSKPHEPTTADDFKCSPLIYPSLGSADAIRASFRCFRFTHLDTGVELLFVFPDESVALTCLNLCQLYGGQSIHRKPTPEALFAERSATRTVRCIDSTHPLVKTGASVRDSKSHDRGRILDSTDPISRKDRTAFVQTNEEKFPASSRSVSGKAFFMQSIKQFLNRSTCGQISTVNDDPAPSSSLSSDVESKLAAILGDPPDFCDLENPGPVFGSPLEDQLESPDYPFVPVLLHCFVTSLEFHGISLLGLYRKPGRQRSINQFVCVSNLVPKNVDFLLTLDAWREPYAICGLLKYFLRRLPSRLLDLASWEPLALLAPDKDSPLDVTRLAYLLLSIRVKLLKMANEAYGVDHMKSPSKAVACNPTDRSHASAKWRWATLLYVVEHLRNVVSHETRNEVTYQCAAICFGPVLFDSSIHVDKLNAVLENVLKHWRWLTDCFPTAELTDLSSPTVPRIQTHDWNLQEAVNYLRTFELNESGSKPLRNEFHLNKAHADSSITSGALAPPQFEGTDSLKDDFYGLRQVKSLLDRALEKAETSGSHEPLTSCEHSSLSRTPLSVPYTSVELAGNGQSSDCCTSSTIACSYSHPLKQHADGTLIPSIIRAPSPLSKPTLAMHHTNELHHPIRSRDMSLLSESANERLPRSSSYDF